LTKAAACIDKFGLRWQTKCDTAFPDAYSRPNLTCRPKAPATADDRHQSRFAGALHKKFARGCTMFTDEVTVFFGRIHTLYKVRHPKRNFDFSQGVYCFLRW